MKQVEFEHWLSQSCSLSQDQRALVLSTLASLRESATLPAAVNEKGRERDLLQSSLQRKKTNPRNHWYSRYAYIVFMSMLVGAFFVVVTDS